MLRAGGMGFGICFLAPISHIEQNIRFLIHHLTFADLPDLPTRNAKDGYPVTIMSHGTLEK